MIRNSFIVFAALCLWTALWQRAGASGNSGSVTITALEPDEPGGYRYTLPLVYGHFADVEILNRSQSTGEIEVAVYDDEGSLIERRVAVLPFRRPIRATEVLGVENLFAISRPASLRLALSLPATLIHFRRD